MSSFRAMLIIHTSFYAIISGCYRIRRVFISSLQTDIRFCNLLLLNKDFSGNKVVHHDNRSCKDFCNGVNQVVADVLLQCSAPPVDGSYYNPDQEAVQQHSDQGKDDEGNEFDFFRSKTNLKLKM